MEEVKYEELCEIYKYKGSPQNLNYNDFFNPNICHVCKSRSNGCLISCAQCKLVFYCKEEHQHMHMREHAEICAIISSFLISKKPRQDESLYRNRSQWMKERKDLLDVIQKKTENILKRPMENYEKQIILLSKSCMKCRRQTELQTCERCHSVNYCNYHAKWFHSYHANSIYCKSFRRLLNINITKCIYDIKADIISRYNKLFCFHHFSITVPFINTGKKPNIENIRSFFSQYIKISNDMLLSPAVDHIIIDYVSKPLAIYYGLEKTYILDKIISPSSECIIHVICGYVELVDENDLRAWELLFHLLPKLFSVVIVLIGPNLSDVDSGYIECCVECCIKKKKLRYIYVAHSYDVYISSPYSFKDPDIIVSFHTEMFNFFKCKKSIKAMKSRESPLVLISLTKKQATRAVQIIKKFTDTTEVPTYIKNPFCSFIPDVLLKKIRFRHSWITIFSENQRLK